jgi:pimeloyl-ACP methyl ester carboxylesterase
LAKVDVNGIGIAYDIIGDGKKNIAITAGGRFSKDTPGLRELAGELAAGGDYRVLIWDRVSCGESDINFDGQTESIMNADAFAGLLRALDYKHALLVGGSAGSRVSLMTAIRHPDLVSGLFLLWISGGPIGLATLAMHYCAENALVAEHQGMEAVANLPAWQEQVTRNPGNRARILAQDPDTFVATMQRWADSFFPKSAAPVPGLDPAELAAIKVPTVILRSGKSDLHHTRETSEALHQMMPGSQLREPPWPDNEWTEGGKRADRSLFRSWPQLAPQILELAGTIKS